MKMEAQGITKEQSACLQGVAILLMIHHHFFNDLSIYGEALSFWNPAVAVRVAWFGKICVGVFAFVSGYGTCKVLKKRGESSLRVCSRQVLHLLLRYWCVLILFMGLFFALGIRTFEAKEFLLNFFCIKTTYNGAFWYVQQYFIMMILMTLFEGFLRLMAQYKAKGWKRFSEKERLEGVIYGLLILGGIAWGMMAILLPTAREGLKQFIDVIRIAFVAIFFMGWLLAKYKIYDILFDKFENLKLPIRVGIGFVLIIIVVTIRTYLADSPAYARMDFLLVPVFVLGVLMILGRVEILLKVFGGLGRISAYMWLIHLFIFELTKDWITKSIHSHLLFYLIELGLNILVGILLYFVEKKLKKKAIAKQT